MAGSLVKGYTCSTASLLEFYDMITYMRPAGSDAEIEFIKKYLGPLTVNIDKAGNIYKEIGKSPVVWSSHTDTVHSNEGRQLIKLFNDRTLKLHPNSRANCLGADDTAGVWLMIEMIKANRPGLYIFHRAEERGGKGSKWLADNNAKALDGRECVIALDRRDNDSVITFQWGGRCCSDDFGNSLIKALDLGYKLDQTGSFTDSASYVDIVGECTNLSVGYLSQHCRSESLDMKHLLDLRERLLLIDARDLVYKRKAGTKEYRTYSYGGNAHHGYGDNYYYGSGTRSDDFYKFFVPASYTGGYWLDGVWTKCTKEEWEVQRKLWMEPNSKTTTKITPKVTPKPATTVTTKCERHIYKSVGGKAVEITVSELVKDYPMSLAEILEDWGFDAGTLRDVIYEHLERQMAEAKATANESKDKPANVVTIKPASVPQVKPVVTPVKDILKAHKPTIN